MGHVSLDKVTAKQRIKNILEEQPEDASYEELLRELALDRMIESGLDDVRSGKTISHEEALRRIQGWRG